MVGVVLDEQRFRSPQFFAPWHSLSTTNSWYDLNIPMGELIPHSPQTWQEQARSRMECYKKLRCICSGVLTE